MEEDNNAGKYVVYSKSVFPQNDNTTVPLNNWYELLKRLGKKEEDKNERKK
jgi:hypothetical protein